LAQPIKQRLTKQLNTDADEIFEMYRSMGYTLRETADELEVKYSTLKTWAWKAGVKFNEVRDPNDYLPKKIKYKGSQYTVSELAKMAGISRSVVSDRLRNGWSVERAVTTPLQPRREPSKGKDKSTEGVDIGRLWLRGKL